MGDQGNMNFSSWPLNTSTQEIFFTSSSLQDLYLESREGLETDRNSFPLYLRIWVSVASGIIFVVGVSGNALVPILVWKNRQLRHSTNIFLLNLAAADILVLLICLPTALVELHTRPNSWVLGSLLCRLVPFIEISVTRASIFTLTVISVERYVAICKPLKSTTLCTRPRALGVCLAIWPISCLIAGPVIVATEHQEIIVANGHKSHMCVTTLQEYWISGYYVGSAGTFFVAPFIFLAFVYALIAKNLLSQRARSRKKTDSFQWRSRKQVATMLGAVVFIFFVCLLPFQIFSLWLIFSPEEDINALGPHIYYNILFACRALIYANSASNPIVYNAMSAKFRIALLKLFGFSTRPTKRLLRRQSTSTTTFSSSSLLSSSSLRRRASLALQRSHSNASFSRRTDSPRSSSFSFAFRHAQSFRNKYKVKNAKDDNASFKLVVAKSFRKNESGAYFSSGSHSNVSSIADIRLPFSPVASGRSKMHLKPLLQEDCNGFFKGKNSSLISLNSPTPGTSKRVAFSEFRSDRTGKKPVSPLTYKEPVQLVPNPSATNGEPKKTLCCAATIDIKPPSCPLSSASDGSEVDESEKSVIGKGSSPGKAVTNGGYQEVETSDALETWA